MGLGAVVESFLTEVKNVAEIITAEHAKLAILVMCSCRYSSPLLRCSPYRVIIMPRVKRNAEAKDIR